MFKKLNWFSAKISPSRSFTTKQFQMLFLVKSAQSLIVKYFCSIRMFQFCTNNRRESNKKEKHKIWVNLFFRIPDVPKRTDDGKVFFSAPPPPSQLNAVLCPGLGQSSSPGEEMFDQGDEGNTWGVRRGGWVGTWSWHLIWGSRFGAQLPMIGNCTLKNKRCCWGCCFWCWIRHGFVCEWTVAATRWMINLAKCLDNLISLCELLTVFWAVLPGVWAWEFIFSQFKRLFF